MDLFPTRGEKIFYAINYFLMALLAFVAIFPFYLVLIRSIAPTSDYVLRDVVLYPSKISMDYFNMLFRDPATKIFTAYKNTIFKMVFQIFAK